MTKGRDKKNFKLSGKLRLKLSLRLGLMVAAAISVVAAGIFLYVNFSNSSTTTASEAANRIIQEKPVDFNVPELKINYKEETLNGIRIRKAVDLTSSVN